MNIFLSLLHVIDFHRSQIQLLTLSLASAIGLPVKDGKVRVPDKNKTDLDLGWHGRMPPVTGLMQAPVFKIIRIFGVVPTIFLNSIFEQF